jgi:hypothetical protein
MPGGTGQSALPSAVEVSVGDMPFWLLAILFTGGSILIALPLALMFNRKEKPPAEEPRRKKKRPDEPRGEATDTEETPAAAPTATDLAAAFSTAPAQARPLMPFPAPAAARDPGMLISYFCCRANRPYRVYLMPDKLLFIEAGPGDGKQWADGGQATAGVVGGLLGGLVANECHEQTKARERALDRATPEDLQALIDGTRNFRIHADEVTEVAIDAPGWMESLSGDVMGHLRVIDPRRGKLTFALVTIEDMQKAIDLLPGVLGESLSVNVVLDRKSWRYVRK